jgi:hypothetical protein
MAERDAFIIAVVREEDSLLASERERLSEWAPNNGWQYLEYVDAVDLLSQLTETQSMSIRELEIVAHGNPAECNDVSLENARTFGESLSRVRGFSRGTAVYLSGCNTALQFGGDCVARTLAEATQMTVCGAQGYLAGTRAERNERCVRSFTHGGILYEAFSGAIDSAGGDVWRCFTPSLKAVDGDDMDVKISTSGFRPINLSGDKAAELRRAVEEAIHRPSSEPAPFRIAPDLRFAIRLSDGEHIFELVAGGTVLRDPISKRVWQLPGGRTILESLWPYRNGAMPAA